MKILDIITELSHEFGTSDYVLGGGGNTSCKDEQTLWVKPSGTTLAGLAPEKFVAIDRAKMARLYDIAAPEAASEREALVKSVMAEATLASTPGRASVEAPLHETLNARYVVHTHPALVNGMTCSKNGKAVCAELFPEALWLDYIDPGYTLCMVVRREIKAYQEQHGFEPELIFLKNHGVFVSADTPEKIRELYARVMGKLRARYSELGVETKLELSPLATKSSLSYDFNLIRQVMDNQELKIAVSGGFEVAPGPISPDHLVYAKAFPYLGVPTAAGVAQFIKQHGYPPHVFRFNQSVFGVSESENGAQLALELAKDGAIVERLAAAFGGVDYMSDSAREFIENWEVESYRKKQI
ncbi:MAG: class II aldolase/adducin family protein [Kiritimatiellae bacterium]|nr:class II aldolase/adducin family protein [Kiritimatiellia bacterium]